MSHSTGSSSSSYGDDASDPHSPKGAGGFEGALAGDMGTPGMEINISSLDEVTYSYDEVIGVRNAWQRLLASAGSIEGAGDAILTSLLEGAPSLAPMFTAPRAVQAMRLGTSLTNIIRTMDQPGQLKLLAETLGFEHMHLDITLPRVVIFRDCVVDVLAVELGEAMTTQAQISFKALMSYLGGAIVFVKEHYSERISIIMTSWALANRQANGNASTMAPAGVKESGLGLGNQNSKDDLPGDATAGDADGKLLPADKGGSRPSGGKDQRAGGNNTTQNDVTVPTTYKEMFQFNAAVMGLAEKSWLQEVLGSFDNLVKSIQNAARMQEECDILMLRIARLTTGPVNWMEYKSCMLASLRSLLPKDWSTNHEAAWSWMWENVERLLKKNIGSARRWEQAWDRLLHSWDEETKFQIRTSLYTSFFTAAPAGQDYFKQSNTFLHFIADRVFDLTLELFTEPDRLVDDISALGLRHAGYGVPTELFATYVTSAVNVVKDAAADEAQDAVEAFSWSIALLAKMLARTTTEGSTLVMKAININSQKQLIKALASAPRGDRANWMLLVQVGTQNISPLAWAISSGSQATAKAIIEDLLTIRADRERYYYGAGDLFHRHPDLVQILCNDAPALLHPLFDGLVWRSSITEQGRRRVNLFLHHLLVAPDGSLAKTIQWVSEFQDPKLACHPIIMQISNMVWSRVAYSRFLFDKAWSLLTLIVFLISQTVIEHLHDDDNFKAWERYTVFVCRAFIYLSGLPMFIYRHCRQTYHDIKGKRFTRILGIPAPSHLDEWKELMSFLLLVSLLSMLMMEPIFWCWPHAGDKMFDAHCPEEEHILMPYSIASAIAVLLYFVVLIDMAVFSSRVSAFVLLCSQMTREVSLFLVALLACLVVFASAISVLDQGLKEFDNIPKSLFTFLEIATGTFPKSKYHHFEEEPIALLVVFVFLILCVIFIIDLLIAQLTCAYQAVYSDMLGYARLSQMRIITETAPYVPKKTWTRFVESLKLEEKIEFNAGDIGLAGGIQVTESATAHPTTIDRIRRYGGSTSRSKQWPVEDSKDASDETDRISKMEELVAKTLKKVKKHSRRGTGGGTTIGSSLSKASGTGSAKSESSSGG